MKQEHLSWYDEAVLTARAEERELANRNMDRYQSKMMEYLIQYCGHSKEDAKRVVLEVTYTLDHDTTGSYGTDIFSAGRMNLGGKR